MTTQFFLTKEYPCPECNGQGWIVDLLWQEFLSDFPGDYTDEQFTEWWAGNGYYDPKDVPDGLERCFECEGSGRARKEADLVEALKFYGVMTNE